VSRCFLAKFEPFLKSYYDKFKFESIDSEQFKAYFLDYFKGEKAVQAIDWDTWFNQPGMPKIKPKYDDRLARGCQDLRDRWVKWDGQGEAPFTAKDVDGFSSPQMVEFLSLLLLEEPLSQAKLETMGELYKLTETKNAEIRMRWIRLGLRGQYDGVVDNAVRMVTEQGRMKFLRPIYRFVFHLILFDIQTLGLSQKFLLCP
jgi:leukotriene-A4 hydrolase